MTETAAQRRASLKWRKKAYDTFLLRLRQDRTPTKAEIEQAATDAGQSIHEYIITAIIEKMNR